MKKHRTNKIRTHKKKQSPTFKGWLLRQEQGKRVSKSQNSLWTAAERTYQIHEVSFHSGLYVNFFLLRLLQWLSDLCEQWMTTGTIDLHLFDILFAGKRKRHTHKTRAEWKCASDRIWMANKFRVLSMSKGGTHNLLLSSFPIEMFTHFSAIAFFWLWFRIHMLAKHEKQLRNNLCTEFFFSWSDKMWGVTWHWQIFPTITFQLELLSSWESLILNSIHRFQQT